MKLVFVVSFITLLLTFMVGVLSLSLGVMLGVSILVLSVHGLFFMFMKGLVFTFWVGVVVFLVVEGLLGIMIGVGLGYFKNFSGVIEFVIVGGVIYLLGWFFGLPKFMVMMLKEVWGSRGTFIFYKVWTLIISYKSFNSFRCMVSTGALSAFFNGSSEEECGSHLNLPNYKVFNEESKEWVYCFSGGSEGSSYSGVSISSSPILKAFLGALELGV